MSSLANSIALWMDRQTSSGVTGLSKVWMHGRMDGRPRLLLLSSPVPLVNLLFTAYANNCYLALSFLLLLLYLFLCNGTERDEFNYVLYGHPFWQCFFCFSVTVRHKKRKKRGSVRVSNGAGNGAIFFFFFFGPVCPGE